MIVTDVRVRIKQTETKLRAIASVTFDDEFVVKDIRVIEGAEGKNFIAMPCRKMSEGTFRDIAHPITKEAREKVETAILEEYEKELALVASNDAE